MAAWVNGHEAGLDGAVETSANILAQARAPLIGGLAADVAAIRAAYRLAFATGASLDPAGSAGLYTDLAVLSSSGQMFTTPAEALARADLAVLIGTRAATSPLAAEFAARPVTRGSAGTNRRRLIALAETAPASVDSLTQIALPGAQLAPAIGLLRGLAANRIHAPAGDMGALTEVLPALTEASFGVVLYDAEELGELAVEMLHGLVKDLNATRRFTTLPIVRETAARGALQVGAWTTGDAPRVGLGRGFPEHDPWRFDAARLLATGEADTLLWLAALPAPPPPGGAISTIALVGRAEKPVDPASADVVIEVAVPGETGSGAVWDQRRATFVFSSAQAGPPASRLPPASHVLSAIEAAVAATRRAA
ncbi:formyltransferase [Chelatococcus sp. GCM10030263]|uniref:formyltransferase n=1 Tax=Chelatococcus sp. GCM10030263 TaxID=3273387 RepID=UPI003623C3E3